MEEKMQHRIVKFKYAEYTGICQKNMLMISKRKTVIKKMTEYKKMQYRLCILPFLEVTTYLINIYIIVGNTVGKSRRAF